MYVKNDTVLIAVKYHVILKLLMSEENKEVEIKEKKVTKDGEGDTEVTQEKSVSYNKEEKE